MSDHVLDTTQFFRHRKTQDVTSFPTRRSSDLDYRVLEGNPADSDHVQASLERHQQIFQHPPECYTGDRGRSEEHTSELQSLRHLVCRLLLEKKKKTTQ